MATVDEITSKGEKGTLSIHTENIFPIIKKFLYSDTEIFLRELVSNAVDATQKVKRLSSLSEFTGELGDLKVKVSVDKEARTITVSDNGIGMTADEIKKYINQIAFSGATEFMEKYKASEGGKIIGHFGLGFYSSFMVAKEVEIHSLSYKEGAEAARWVCDGSTEFEIGPCEKTERGTDIILHVAEDSDEYLESHKLREILNKYGKFLPIEVEFAGNVINKTAPIWTKSPSDLVEKDYLDFYKELYPYAGDPLFWIHLNVDYPFELTGILYFPKVKQDLMQHKDKIQLYSRQVFITDEVKDIVPEFMMLLHGVIDSPDIPLNVSRSFLQADKNVKQINSYITRKVSDKLNELFKNDRPAFEKKWDSIGLFVKYGMVTDEKFYEKAEPFALLRSANDEKCYTFAEYKEYIAEKQTDKDGKLVVLYTTDEVKQHSFLDKAKKEGYDVIKFNSMVDTHFIGLLERKLENTSLRRVDSDTIEKLIDKDTKHESKLTEEQSGQLLAIFKKATGKEENYLKVEALSENNLPVAVTLPEFMRRMQEMAITTGMGQYANLDPHMNITINANHALTAKVLALETEEEQEKLAKHLYDLALLSQNLLQGADLTRFVERSVTLIA